MGQYTEEYRKIMFENMELCKKDQDLYNSILASRANQKIIKEKVKYNTLTTGINAHAETKVILTGCKSFEAAINYTAEDACTEHQHKKKVCAGAVRCMNALLMKKRYQGFISLTAIKTAGEHRILSIHQM